MSEAETQTEQQRISGMLEKISRDVYSTDVRAPGLAVRLDRLERQIATLLKVINWIGSGGLVGLAGTVYLLWRILQAFDKVQG